MNPIVAEIFPVMAKFFKNDFLEARALLDYKWFVVPLKEEDPNDQNIFKKSIDDFVNLCATEGRENVIQPENFPLPFEKFFMVFELIPKNNNRTFAFDVTQITRHENRIYTTQYNLVRVNNALKVVPCVNTEFLGYSRDNHGFFKFHIWPAKKSHIKTEDLTKGYLFFPKELRLNCDGPLPDGDTLMDCYSNTAYNALVCSTYGMFGPISETLHYHATTNPDPLRNAQKIARGNRPKFEWVTSVIEPRTTAPALVLHRGGTHASPKPHERRAHFRRLKSGKSVLVRSTVINKDKMGDRGFVFHDYELSA
jgi:hypothetical protein